MILTAAIYTKAFCALSHKITLVRFWARGWLTVRSSVALKWSCQQFSDLFTDTNEASSNCMWRQTMHRSANLNFYQLSCHNQYWHMSTATRSAIRRHIPCLCAEPWLSQLPAKSYRSSLVLLGPRTVKQSDMASKPSDTLPIPSGTPHPGASGRQLYSLFSVCSQDTLLLLSFTTPLDTRALQLFIYVTSLFRGVVAHLDCPQNFHCLLVQLFVSAAQPPEVSAQVWFPRKQCCWCPPLTLHGCRPPAPAESCKITKITYNE